MAKASKLDALKLEDEISFPLYAASKEIIRRYKPFLEELDLTYTQYLAMLALWEHSELAVNEMGELLYLDSGTLTPLLKKLEAKGYIVRTRSVVDERRVVVTLTEAGKRLRTAAAKVPAAVKDDLGFDAEDERLLSMTLNWLLDRLNEDEEEE
mgnify:CR=1 FL=1